MHCVRTFYFPILIIGESTGMIIPSRGLRQRDPLSPYMFLICTEELIGLLTKANTEKRISGIKICRGAPMINHLLFANDSILFCKIALEENKNIFSLLKKYEASGWQIYRVKTSMTLSKKVQLDVQRKILGFWGLTIANEHSHYLGPPPLVGQDKKRTFLEIICKMWRKLKVWKDKFLSWGGKELWIKVVTLSIPTFTMSYFKLPKKLWAKLEQLMDWLWCYQKEEEKKIQWVEWKNMFRPKGEGGMGFKKLHISNMEMLAKRSWWIMRDENSLLHKPYKARYPQEVIYACKFGKNTVICTWRTIWEARSNIYKGCQRRVGDRKSIRIWLDY